MTVKILDERALIVVDGKTYMPFDEIRADVDSGTTGRIDYIKDRHVVASSGLDVQRGRVTPRDVVVLVSRVDGMLEVGYEKEPS